MTYTLADYEDRQRGPEPMAMRTIRWPREMFDAVRERAAAEGTTTSDLIRRAAALYLGIVAHAETKEANRKE